MIRRVLITASVLLTAVIAAVALEFCGLFYWVALAWFYGDLWPTQEITVPSGYALISQAKQIDMLFGPAWHQVCNFRKPDIEEWQSKALFGGKYELTMIVPIQIDRRSGIVKKIVRKPEFVLVRIESITRLTDGRDERFELTYGVAKSFGSADWEKVIAANGDFSVIGIHLDPGKPIANYDAYKNSPNAGLKMVGPGAFH